MKRNLLTVFLILIIGIFASCKEELSKSEIELRNNIESQIIKGVEGDIVEYNSGSYLVIRINQPKEKILYLGKVARTGILYQDAVKKIKRVIRYKENPIEYARASFLMNGGKIEN